MKRRWQGWPFNVGKTFQAELAAALVAACAGFLTSTPAGAADDGFPPARGQINAEASRPGPAALGVTLADNADGTVSVSGVMPNSPAAEAGIRPGDQIQAINDLLVSNSRDVIYMVSSQTPGKKITIRVDRGGLKGALRATLRSRREVNQRAALGVTFSRATTHSVRVLSVVPNSPAAKAGIKPGDRIASVNDEPVANYEDVIRLLGDANAGERIRLKVDRYGLEGTVLAKLDGGQQVYQAPRPFVLPPTPRPVTQDDLLFRNTPAQIDDQRGYGD
ncbi:MAG TPA: PDZ domain-containing protein [Pirellulales bacterium]|jgi:S1-C subfamily serine protease|nr:PDZ domain-containing protein [Pirellulales bacterium]